MRIVLLGFLVLTGCSQILGLEDIDAADAVDDDPDTATVTGKVVVYPRPNGQNNIGVDVRRNDTGQGLPGAVDTTAGGGLYEVRAPTDYDGFIGFFDEGSGFSLHRNSFHGVGLFESDVAYQLTAFETDHAALTADAELPSMLVDLPFARLQIYDQSTNPFPDTTVRVTGPGSLEIRYTDAAGKPRPGLPGTTIATRGDGENFAVAYVFGLSAGEPYLFEAEFGSERVGIGHAIVAQADTIPTVVLKFTNLSAPGQ